RRKCLAECAVLGSKAPLHAQKQMEVLHEPIVLVLDWVTWPRRRGRRRGRGRGRTGSWSQCMRKSGRGISMDLPSHRIAACLGKAALKPHALQTLRDRRASPNRAKRLECVRFIGAGRPAVQGSNARSKLNKERARRTRTLTRT